MTSDFDAFVNRVTGLPDYRVTGLPDYRVTGLPDDQLTAFPTVKTACFYLIWGLSNYSLKILVT